jgi:hypothetical protein
MKNTHGTCESESVLFFFLNRKDKSIVCDYMLKRTGT